MACCRHLLIRESVTDAGSYYSSCLPHANGIIFLIFKDPATQYVLTEFENLGKPIHEIMTIYPKTAAAFTSNHVNDQAKTRVEQLIEEAVRA